MAASVKISATSSSVVDNVVATPPTNSTVRRQLPLSLCTSLTIERLQETAAAQTGGVDVVEPIEIEVASPITASHLPVEGNIVPEFPSMTGTSSKNAKKNAKKKEQKRKRAQANQQFLHEPAQSQAVLDPLPVRFPSTDPVQ